MNANEILDMIGDAKGTYLWETQKYRDGTAGAKPLPRLWLVAAVIGLMLLLVGCTVAYVLRLQDLKVAEYRPTTPTVYDENGDVISLPREPRSRCKAPIRRRWRNGTAFAGTMTRMAPL